MVIPVEQQFEHYLTANRPAAEQSYLRGRIFPALQALEQRRQRFAATQTWLTAGLAALLLALPVLLLWPYALPETLARLLAAGASALCAGALFAQQLLRLPERALDCAQRSNQLCALLHAYFLEAADFAGLSADERLRRLYALAEPLLHP